MCGKLGHSRYKSSCNKQFKGELTVPYPEVLEGLKLLAVKKKNG